MLFYDTCSFRYHANMAEESIDSIFAYIKEQDGIIVITRCILMELASSSGILNQEYIQYCQKISQSGLSLYVINEEDLFQVMEICFSINASINNFLVWSVRMMKGPGSTIIKTLDEDKALNDVVIKGRNPDNKGVYKRFFSSVRANKESGDNLGEELLGICLHILSQLPGEEDGKFCIITDDKEAAGKIDEKVSNQGKRNDILREIARLEGKQLDDTTCGHGDHKLKTRDSIGKEYELSGSSVGRLLKLNDLIKPFKDMLDRGSLYTKVGLQMAFLPEVEQMIIYEAAKEKNAKLTLDMVMKLRSHSGALTDEMVRQYISMEPIKKKCYKVPARIVEKYFIGMDSNKVDSIVEQALEAWFNKGKDGVDV